ncbi:hypothetical protein ACTI_33700 [Actinoplanes sp. OR16]|uniref:DUF6188 family protein n=1 Tax=Actinoplanes sp. OR16 TaxID=946334 RepID=UPI000F6D7848|nr:DUF6188 family protein [Actinoplanes sp. OR16]BBH66685.1 hypothetical protein ACTI_33700 [Actinoplanes sp. OR16]
MDLGFAGREVVAQDFGYTVALTFSGGYEIRIETAFTLFESGRGREITPGEEGDAELVGRVVESAAGDDRGGLRIDFGGGVRLIVPADDDFEAWTLAGPDGLKVVSTPGGELSVWSPPGE